MKQPTYQQVSELYHELWELQRNLEESEKDARAYKEAYRTEEEFSYKLCAKIRKVREHLKDGDVASALEELSKEV